MRSIKDKRGVTLVELIVVLVILAILASVLIPSLIGYIDKAKQRAVIAEARDVWTASQAALSECYAMYPESFAASCKFTSTIDGKKMTKLGRISNGALHALQKNPNDPTEAGTSSRATNRRPTRCSNACAAWAARRPRRPISATACAIWSAPPRQA